MKKIYLLLLAVSLSLLSCEKDDICSADTPTTPQLVIEFYDAVNPTVLRTVTNLGIAEDGNPILLGIFTSVNKIKIPLKVTDDITKYRFIYNYGSTNISIPINEDKLEFDYTRNNVFVSRACGYKTLFTLTGNPALSDPVSPANLWIQSITVKQANILDENETHIKIYF
jgi:hypothetical protein